MPDNDMHLTRSHLLRRLLQRRVEQLEGEKAELQLKVQALEERLTHPSDDGSGELPDSGHRALSQTVEQVRMISEQAQRSAAQILRVTRQEQEKLANEVNALYQESQTLRLMLLEALEGVNSIVERAQSGTAHMVNAAHGQQEQLSREIEGIYHDEGNDGIPRATIYRRYYEIRERAEQSVAQVEAEAEATHRSLLREVEILRWESERIREAIAVAVERTQAISTQTQSATERAIANSVPDVPHSKSAKRNKAISANGHYAFVQAMNNEDAVLQRARSAILATQDDEEMKQDNSDRTENGRPAAASFQQPAPTLPREHEGSMLAMSLKGGKVGSTKVRWATSPSTMERLLAATFRHPGMVVLTLVLLFFLTSLIVILIGTLT